MACVFFSSFSPVNSQTIFPALPPNLNRAPGQILILSASPRSGGTNYTYVWKKDGVNLSPTRLATDPVYFRGPLTSADEGLYSMIIQQGGTPIATNQTRLRVSDQAPQGPGLDDFSRASGRWSGMYGFDTHDSYLSLTNGRLNYVVEPRGAKNTQAFYVWNSKARSDQDWEVMVEANIAATIAPSVNSGQYFALRLSATVATNAIAPFDGSQGLETTFAVSSGTGRHIQNVECTLADPGWRSLPDQVLPSSTTNVVLRLSYDKSSKVLTSYYDADGAANGYQWRPGERLSMAGAVGLANNFDLVISGIAENAHPAVASGQAYFDNFSYVLSDRRQFSVSTVGWSILLNDGPGVVFSTYDGVNSWPQGFPTNFSGELKPVTPGSGTYRTDYATWSDSSWDSFGDISVTLPIVDSNGDSLPNFLEPSLATSLTSNCTISNNLDTITNGRLVMTKAAGATSGLWTVSYTSANFGPESIMGSYKLLGASGPVLVDPNTKSFLSSTLSYDGTEELWSSGSYAVASNGEIQVANFWETSVMKTTPFQTNRIGNLAFSVQKVNSTQLKGTFQTSSRPWTPGYNSFENTFVKLNGVDFSIFTPRVSSPDYARAQVGQPFSFQVTSLDVPNSYTASGLPPGLSINSGTGLISGTPTIPGLYPVVLSAANVHGTGPVQTNYFTVLGPNRTMPLDDGFITNSLSGYLNFTVNPTASLTHASGRLNYAVTGASTNLESIAGIVPSLTLSVNRSWRVEADVRVPNTLVTPYTGAGLSLLREVDGGGVLQLYPDRINLKLARDTTNYCGMHSFFDEVEFSDVSTNLPTVSEARVRFIYDSSRKTLTGSYRPVGASAWTDLGSESLNPALFGSLGQAWELTDSSVLRVALWADSQVNVAGGNVWVDNLLVTEEIEAPQTTPAIAQQPASQTVAALSPVTFSVSASGGALAYQWQRNGTNLAGANASNYTFSPTVAMAGDYRVVITNSLGSVTSAIASLTVNKATPATTWNALAPITYGTALSASQLNASSGVAGAWGYHQAIGTVLNAGTYSLAATFTPADAANYESVTRTNALTVNKAAQTIANFNLSSGTVGSPVSLAATATAGAVVYTSSEPTLAQISGNQVLFLRSGYATITASHPGDGNYLPVSVARNLTVKAPMVRFEFDPNTLLLGGVGTTAGAKDSAGAKLVIGNPNNYYQATVVSNAGVVTTNYTPINTLATYSNMILGQPTGLNAYTNWVAGLGAGEGLARFNVFLRGDLANASSWGQLLKLGPTNSPELTATGDAANGWNYKISQFGTNVPGNTNWGYYIEWFTTNDALRLRPGGVDLGAFTFTAPLEQSFNGNVSQIQFGQDGWSSTDYTVWFGTQNNEIAGSGTPFYALKFDNLWGTANGGGVTPFGATTNSLWNGTLALRAQDQNIRKVWYVTPDGAGRRDGMGWANAFDNLQAAIDRAASGDEIWVKKGVYKPNRYIDPFVTNDPRSRSFILKGGVSVYGGFAGAETVLGQRDPSTNITTLSGDFSGNDSQDWPPGVSRNENAYHIFAALKQTGEIRLDGFLITGGNANNASYRQPNNGSGIPYQSQDGGAVCPHELGGAGLVAWSSLRLENSTVALNHGLKGGGIVAYAGGGSGVIPSAQQLAVRNCEFQSNLSSSSNYGLGGALQICENIQADLQDAIFSGNRAPNGGALAVMSDRRYPYPAKARIVRCAFEDNQAFVSADADGDGLLDNGHGGAIHLEENVEALIGNVVFARNRVDPMGLLGGKTNDPSFGVASGHGGAMTVVDGAKARIVNSLFVANRAEWAGGGIHVDKWTSSPSAGQVEVYFSTFSGNVARWGGGINNHKSGLTGSGNIFFQNTNLQSQVDDVSNATSLDGTQAVSSLSYCVTTANAIFANSGVGNRTGNPGFYASTNAVGRDDVWGTTDDGFRLLTNTNSPAYALVSQAPPLDFADLDQDGNVNELLPIEALENTAFPALPPYQAGCYQLTRDSSPGNSPGVWDFAVGNYELKPGEGLLLELGGTEASLYDRIFARAGSVTLDGIVNLMFWGTYTGPVAGSWDTFDLVWARDGIVLGDHLQVHFLQSGYQWETQLVDRDGGKLWQAKVRAATTSNPDQAATSAKPFLSAAQSPGPGGETELFYTYRRPVGGGYAGGAYSAGGVRFVVEISDDLRLWNPVSTSEISATQDGDGWERATVLVRGPSQKGFLRIRTTPAN